MAYAIFTSYGSEQEKIGASEIMERIRVFVRHPEHVPDVGFVPVYHRRKENFWPSGEGW